MKYFFALVILVYISRNTIAQSGSIIIKPSDNLKTVLENIDENSSVHIKAGIYYAENIRLYNKQNIIISADSGTIIIKQHFDCSDFIEVIKCSDIKISGLTLLYVTKIEDNNQVNCGRGIKVLNSENIIISETIWRTIKTFS